MNDEQKPLDKIDAAIDATTKAVDEPTIEDPGAFLFGQANLIRLLNTPSKGTIRIMVPREFDEQDYVAVAEIALNLLRAAKQARENPAGLELPGGPRKGLVGMDGQRIS